MWRKYKTGGVKEWRKEGWRRQHEVKITEGKRSELPRCTRV